MDDRTRDELGEEEDRLDETEHRARLRRWVP